MKYYLDTEFIEDFTNPWFGKKRHYIDLISLALVAEDGREGYWVSNEFDLAYVWHKCQPGMPDETTGIPEPVYWLRENVLRPIYEDLKSRVGTYGKTYHPALFDEFSLKCLKTLIGWYGKSNRTIAQEISEFVFAGLKPNNPTQFYAYYADYDWVLLCSLFGRMLDLPPGFPYYCRDLKQTKVELEEALDSPRVDIDYTLEEDSDYPVQVGEHNALADARWNKRLHDFLSQKKK